MMNNNEAGYGVILPDDVYIRRLIMNRAYAESVTQFLYRINLEC